MSLWPLIGIAIVIVGFALRFNALLVVTIAGIATGIAGGLDLHSVIAELGKAYNDNRYMSLVWLALPVIGLLEHCGLRERTQQLIGHIKSASPHHILTAYMVLRQLSAALGLTSLGGIAQMVRPIIVPMSEGAARHRYGSLPADVSLEIRAQAAAVDNIGVFFGEDIFLAIGSVLLIKGFLAQYHIDIAPLHLAIWAIPPAICAFIIQAIRLSLLNRRWRQRSQIERYAQNKPPQEGKVQ